MHLIDISYMHLFNNINSERLNYQLYQYYYGLYGITQHVKKTFTKQVNEIYEYIGNKNIGYILGIICFSI